MAELLGRIVGGIIGLAVLQGLSAAVAYAFHNWGQAIRPGTRIIFSALVCGLVLILVPVVAILSDGSGAAEKIAPLAAMVVGLAFFSVFFLPGAWWMTRRLERGDDRPAETFE